MSESLAVAVQSELVRLEGLIRSGLGHFVEVGRALQNIRDGRLYRASHPTFEAYCKDRWQFSRQRANQYIASGEVDEDLTTIVVKPSTESQSRPLASIPKAQRVAAWSEAVETAPNGKVTAKHVQSVVDGIIERPERRGVSPRLRVEAVMSDSIGSIEMIVYALERVAGEVHSASPEMKKRYRDVRARFIRLVRAMGE